MKPLPQYTYLNQGDPWPFLSGARHKIEIDSDGFLRLSTDLAGTLAPAGAAILEAIPQSFDGPWSRVSLQFGSKPDTTYTQLFIYSSDETETPTFSFSADQPFEIENGWKPMPVDSTDFQIAETGYYLWIGIQIKNGGTVSPEIDQIRLESGKNTYIRLLPSIYSLEAESRDVTGRFLKQLGISFEQIEDKITSLPALFDADAAPHDESASWLGSLSEWIDFSLSDAWSETQSRENLGGAFDLHAKRGTLQGLREYLKLYAGVNAIIEDSSTADRLWVLGEDSALGFQTALAPGSLSGSILGSETTLDQSHLAQDNECSAFDPYAHRFTVWIFCAELTRPGALRDAREILDQERPAHTEYQLCLIEPMMRVGAQARVGIDSIVAGSERHSQLDRIVDGTVLAESPEHCNDESQVSDLNFRVCDEENI